MSLWYEKKGPLDDIVISSRVRLARNLIKYPFPNKLNNETSRMLINDVKKALELMPADLNLNLIDLSRFGQNELQYLVEKHMISREMANKQGLRGLILNKDESLSVMVLEEDHLRIQSLLPGLQFEVAYKMCNDFETRLNQYISFAFDEKLGYLTSCPTNIGTGIRVSAMMFLPFLFVSGMMTKLTEALAKFGATIRGVYGENSEATGYIFQISNQTTLGKSEEEIIESMVNIINQIADQERNLRKEFYTANKLVFEDRVLRSYGILANARSISIQEAMEMLASVRLGVNMGVLKYIDIIDLNRLIVDVQPSSINKMLGEKATTIVSNQKRADIIRSVMNKGVC